MSDELQKDPAIDSNATQELSPEELNKVNGGSIASVIQNALNEAKTAGTIVAPRDAAGGIPTGQRL